MTVTAKASLTTSTRALDPGGGGGAAGRHASDRHLGGEAVVSLRMPLDAFAVTAPLPQMLSQKNVEAILGVPRRAFLEALPQFRRAGGVVSALGKLRLVDRVEFVAWLRADSSSRLAALSPPASAAEEADDLLRELGFGRARATGAAR